MRNLRVGAAQLGPIQKAESREQVVARLLALLDKAAAERCDLVVYPELALTTFFPRWYTEDQAEVDAWFERAMPSPATQPLFERAKAAGIGFSLGYAELTPEGRHFNTQILVDKAGTIVGKYRKVHLPGHGESTRSAPSSISRSAISSRAIWASRCGGPWAGSWA